MTTKTLALFPLIAFALFPPQTPPSANHFTAPRLDQWQILGPGGGGAQFNPTISPVNPNLVLLNCDMTGAYISLDAGRSWRMFNLRGVIRYFVLDPLKSNIIYAASTGLYRSQDTGKTWNLLYPKAGEVDHLVNTGDHAEEQIIERGGAASVVNALAVDPSDSNLLYAVISKEKQSALYLSKDSGASWIQLDKCAPASKIYVAPHSSKEHRTLYMAAANSISVFENGVLRPQSAPAGVNRFLDVSAGFPGAGKPIFYAVSGIDWRGGNTGVTGLFVSSDGGANWRMVPIDFLSSAPQGSAELELRAVSTSLHNPGTAYLSFRDHTQQIPKADRSMGVAKTVDAGETWQTVWRDTDSRTASNVKDPWISARLGPAWPENPFSLGVSPVDPNICFGTDFGRTMRTRDGGKTWEGVYAYRFEDGSTTTTGLDVLTVHGIQFDPFDLDHWLVDFTDIGLFESHHGGTVWKEVTSRGIPDEWQNTAYSVVFDPKVKGRIWAVVSDTHDLPRPKMWRRAGVKSYLGGVVLSEDGGQTWKASVNGMPQTAATHILLDPNSPVNSRTLYVCGFGKGVYKSTDSGRSWGLKNAGLEGAEPFAWRMVQDSQGILYLLVARRGEDREPGSSLDGALYRSTDGAEHWQKLALPPGCNAPNGLAVDPKEPSRLYLAAWGRSAKPRDIGGGIFISTDAGKTWQSVLEKDQHVFDVTIDPNNSNVLYATGFESSVWKSMNRGQAWSRVKGYNFKWGQRVVVDPKNPAMIYVCTFGGGIWHGPSEIDNGAPADIATSVMLPAR